MPLDEWAEVGRTTKRRAIPFYGKNASLVVTSYSPVWGTSSTQRYSGTWMPKALQGTQVTVSENHGRQFRALKRGRFQGDVGGEFFSQRRYVKGVIPELASKMKNSTPSLERTYDYHGPVLPWSFATNAITFPPAVESSKEDLNELGATAVARSKPTNSVADLSVALGEIVREGLPKLIGASTWRDRTLSAKKVSGDYLNVEFGWKPLVGEITSVADAISRADDIIRQYRRDSGKLVRRGWDFPTETKVEKSVALSGVSAFTPVSVGDMTDSASVNQGTVIRIRKTTVRRWFRGAYTYHLPDSNTGSLYNAGVEAKKLLGLSLTPETIWNLSPWSWFIDWFSNAGDVISNLTDYATDGLVMRYGYLMEHSLVEDQLIFEGPTGLKDPALRPCTLTLVTETRLRSRANPFGFGVTWDGLSNRQAAILTALGISRR